MEVVGISLQLSSSATAGQLHAGVPSKEVLRVAMGGAVTCGLEIVIEKILATPYAASFLVVEAWGQVASGEADLAATDFQCPEEKRELSARCYTEVVNTEAKSCRVDDCTQLFDVSIAQAVLGDENNQP